MTRINLISPRYLTNRHLIAEYREIRHVPASLKRSLKAKKPADLKIPEKFVLGKGHVSFFYDKGEYLFKRFMRILGEMHTRKFNIDMDKVSFNSDIFKDNNLFNDWCPENDDIELIMQRIKQRISEKPHLYKDQKIFLDHCDFLGI